MIVTTTKDSELAIYIYIYIYILYICVCVCVGGWVMAWVFGCACLCVSINILKKFMAVRILRANSSSKDNTISTAPTLWTGKSGFQFPENREIFLFPEKLRKCPGLHPTFYLWGTASSLPRGKGTVFVDLQWRN